MISVCQKARRNLYLLKQLKKYADGRCLITANSSLGLSILEYCGPLFLRIDASNARQQEKVRRRLFVARAVGAIPSKCWRIAKRDNLCSFWDRLQTVTLYMASSSSTNPHSNKDTRFISLQHYTRRLKSFLPHCIQLYNKSTWHNFPRIFISTISSTAHLIYQDFVLHTALLHIQQAYITTHFISFFCLFFVYTFTQQAF